MDTTELAEARVDESSNILVAPTAMQGQEWARAFFGTTITPDDLAVSTPRDLARKTVYLCGDTSGISDRGLRDAARVFVIRGHSHGYPEHADAPWPMVELGEVPFRVHGGLGVYYRRFFGLDSDEFDRIRAEHTFQSLTESTKPGTARRSGIHLTPVTRDGDALRFRLLRCSTSTGSDRPCGR
ncbi:hypothetical protein ACYSUO_06635 [Streptomyces sp. UC4497]